MRLINADATIASITNEMLKEEINSPVYCALECVIADINSQPTAYDVDKVVNELDKLINIEYEKPANCDENGFGDGEEIYEDGRTQGKYEAYKKSLQIVKSGDVADE